MKKFTLLIACILFASSTYAQQVLSHSVSQNSNGGGVACASDPDDVPGSGDEGISDNILYRAYTPADFGFTGNFDAMGVNFIAEFTDVGGTNPTVTNTVRLYTSDQTFPAGTLTEIASKDFDVTAADDGVAFDVMFDNPVTVTASTELIVAVDISASPDQPNNYDFRIGVNDAGENDPSYLTSNGCGLTSPGTFASIGFPDNHVILNLIGDTNLSTGDFALSQVSIYPNPTSDILNLKIPSNISVDNASMYDALGRKTDISYDNNIIDVSNLASGIYILKIDTSVGNLSKKVIIE